MLDLALPIGSRGLWATNRLIRALANAISESDKIIACSLQNTNSKREHIRCRARYDFVVEGQERTWVPVGEVAVHVFRLFCCSASSISRVEVPESQVLSTGVGGGDDLVVEPAVRRAHPGGLNTDDTLQGQFNAPHFVIELVPRESS